MSPPDRRDGFLILIGALSLLLGYAYAISPAPQTMKSAIGTALNFAPLWVYGVAWLAAGGYCLAAGFTDRRIGGFAVAAAMPTLWGSVYLLSWLHGDSGRGWLTAGIFWALAGAVICVSGLVDPSPIAKRSNP
jgi:hypothetical protein